MPPRTRQRLHFQWWVTESSRFLIKLLTRYPNETDINHVYGVQLALHDGYLTQLHEAYKDDNSVR